MKYAAFTILALCIFTLACRQKELPRDRVQTGSEALLSWRECVDFSDYGLTVCFVKANEYRCPCDADCIWEGAVDFTLKVEGTGIDTTITLTTNSSPAGLHHFTVIGKTTIDIADQSPIDCPNYGVYEKYKVKVVLSN